MFCAVCRKNTFKRDVSNDCEDCPQHSHTNGIAKSSLDDCICDVGFKGDPGREIPCVGKTNVTNIACITGLLLCRVDCIAKQLDYLNLVSSLWRRLVGCGAGRGLHKQERFTKKLHKLLSRKIFIATKNKTGVAYRFLLFCIIYANRKP